MYEENEAIFTEALHKDLRKPRWESVSAEINMNKNDILGCLREIHEWTEVKNTKKNILTIMDKTVIRPEPYGIVLIIGSWNYPLHISLAPLTGAIAAGNCAIIKPSEISPHTANAIEQLLPQYIDPDCFK
jgi:acyl-CoA reductase-like NAD-dependent aldehyde dehydrogenase